MDTISTSSRPALAPRKKDVLPLILLSILLAGIVSVIAGAALAPQYRAVPALLWSLGFCVSGMLLGFLFGIPRTLPSGTVNVAPPEAHANDGAPAASTSIASGNTSNTLFLGTPTPMEINSNLVEVSDWLTKIIVGVGLIELKSLPATARGVAAFIAPSLGVDAPTGMAVVGGIMLFFSVHGFLIGYLLTRIYLSIIIKRADSIVKNESVRLESGKEIDVAELSRLQQKSLDDLQEAVTRLLVAPPPGGADAVSAMASLPAAVKPLNNLLWVDDHPSKNTLLVEQLERDNIKVDQAVASRQALAMLQKKAYDLMITDMARLENGSAVKDAGVHTVREARQLKPELPVIIYCNKDTAALYSTEAEAAGARFITTSGTSLLAAVNKLLRTAP
ncbi:MULTISPECIES: response regulator [unclassified Janthinobacterium]|uniref:response regulator n=1 Tax=unclassified Janthinobacterium TaxID=2610881 RepID=UPI001610FFC5|nr:MULTISPECIES: response regulator [unclassified Janthinobacterium]MBB5368424.1 CheY-like chemotaxis protein [Janthinobacterium sp. K2C7]MBB5382040.1 CheY-like chemotaxis protein [Janthinobacterium sp. K2Li3]MBB5386806.1 CheY-like chemotaxis protein [Janthinobacterium sp. K2E3]